ncbi:transmembrane protein 266 [Engraulis encrasicolus]|uniref:transmembrane protein 266 n=1 Tax=Engraulis encrasicolus TaxID=184585 RepID=UPI002FD2C7DD
MCRALRSGSQGTYQRCAVSPPGFEEWLPGYLPKVYSDHFTKEPQGSLHQHPTASGGGGGGGDLEVISQQVDEEAQCMAPVQLVSFAYRDLPLAALDISLAGSQLLSNMDEEDNREGSNWLKPCCGRRAALWQVCLLSAGFNCFLVACVVLVVVLLTLELLIDSKLLQFNNAFQFAGIIHWISLAILSIFFTETVFRIVVLGIWDYIENKVEVFDGAVIVLSLAPMVASTVANGPSSPWDAISLIITLRIWRVKRIIDAYVLQVKVEMELELQQYEKAKAVREEQLERLTQICQEQAFEIRQLRAHLAQQDLDLAAEREAALQMHHVWAKQSASFQELTGTPSGPEANGHPKTREDGTPTDHVAQDDMNNYISQYYSEPSSDIPDPRARVITTAAIDVHLPTNPSQLPPSLMSADAASASASASHLEHSVSEAASVSASASASESAPTLSRSSCSFSGRHHHHHRDHRDSRGRQTPSPSPSSHTLGSSTDCSSTVREASTSASTDYSGQRYCPPPYCSPLAQLPSMPGGRDPSAVVKELLSSLSEDSCLGQKGMAVDPVNLKLPSPAGSLKASPELEHRLNVYNKRNQEGRVGGVGGGVGGGGGGNMGGGGNVGGFQTTRPLIHLQGRGDPLEEKYRLMEAPDAPSNLGPPV